MNSFEIIRTVRLTEKGTRQGESFNQYTVVADPRANKTQIRQAIEQLFDVRVLEVRTQHVKSKPKRRGRTAGRSRQWKKAIVQVREGDTIPIFRGLEGTE